MMADDTDFASLYRELDIRGACTPEAFRRAYRRRVSQLHPDQRGNAQDVARLQELNRLYDAALDFLRVHGRLPGVAAAATSAAPDPPGPTPDTAETAAFSRTDRRAAHAVKHAFDDAPAGPGHLSRYFILLAVLAIAALVASALKGTLSVQQDTPRETHIAASTDAVPADAGRIALGMEKQRVQRIQGAPVGSHDIRWDYGPSWIDFKCGGVVTDWYSSPLRPLRTATPHPTSRDWDRFDAARPRGC